MSSRLASMSSFSANGSPTWTDGRLDGSSSVNVALARTDAPPIPSRPVAEPNRTTRLPGPGRRGQRQQPLLHQADGHDVDERVALVARVEDELAADRRHADAVAVAADAADDAIDQVARPRVGRVAEPERVEDRDRPGAHREDVAQDAADAGRGALVRLDGARVVVRFDLERDREAVADRDDARRSRPDRRRRPRPRSGSVRSSGFELLYEQCSLHMTLNIASSRSFGSRPPSRSRMASSSSSVTPSRRWSGSTGRSAMVIGPPTATGVRASAARAALSTSERMMPGAVIRAQDRLGRPLRVGHQPGDVAGRVHHAGDRPKRAVRVGRVVRPGAAPSAST